MSAVIPYVAARTTDRGGFESDLAVTFDPFGRPRLSYRDERPSDRDEHGNLWVRVYQGPGKSRVLYDAMHPDRQRECMEQMRCQVCREPADYDEQGWLFIDWQREDSPATWPEGSRTSMPPLCIQCARISVKLCPFLRRAEYVVLRVREPNVYGVSGALYTLTVKGWRSTELDQLSAHSKPPLPGMLASRIFRELRGVTVVELP
ncbi:hypothetical protein ABT039_34820 [Streptomyces lasiicapitis]|uniref:hypothetical protein n=1 Tax=Streptomyces lasiicapitis TaxID=1923961 RepID=UPI003318728C